jgi:electron transport complex protein RnfG
MKSSLRNMTLSLAGIAVVVGVLLALVYNLTAEPRAAAENTARSQAVRDVLPDFDNDPLASPDSIDGCVVFPASMNGKFVGAAVKVETMEGFGGLISIMVGFDADAALTGYSILTHAETPGLGAKAQEWFSSAEGNRSVIGTTGQLALTKDGGTVDGITAATITSRAFVGAINHARIAFLTYKDSH